MNESALRVRAPGRSHAAPDGRRAGDPWRTAGRSGSPLFAADQGAIWHEIGERQARASHLADAGHPRCLRAEERSLEEWVRAFPMPAGRADRDRHQRPARGLDLFDSVETLEREWSRLVGSAASALLDRSAPFGPARRRRPASSHGHWRPRPHVERATIAVADAAVATPSALAMTSASAPRSWSGPPWPTTVGRSMWRCSGPRDH